MVTVETAKIYRGGGRRYLTKKAAIKAEAIAIIKAKYPSERAYYGQGGYMEDPGFHWSGLPRADVLLRRMCRLVRTAPTPQDQGAGTP